MLRLSSTRWLCLNLNLTHSKTTRDGVAETIAANILGHAVLLDGLIERKLLTRAVVLAGSEGARGVPAMGINRPISKSGSVEEFVAPCDVNTFRSETK